MHITYIQGEWREMSNIVYTAALLPACLPGEKGAGLRKFQLLVGIYFIFVILLAVQITTTEKSESKWQRKK